MRISDSLETILSHLSTRVMSTIADGTSVHQLNFLLEFLATWEKRPEYLTRMVCQWCSTIAEAVGRLHSGGTRIPPPYSTRQCVRHNIRLRPQDLVNWRNSNFAYEQFREVRSNHTLGGADATRDQVQYILPQDLYEFLLSILLEVGFRLASIDTRFGNIHPDDIPHHKQIFETGFSSDDDEVVADAVRMWITSSLPTPLHSFARHFTKRLERYTPLSEGLRQLVIRVVKRTYGSEPWESEQEIVYLLNSLDADMDEVAWYQREDVLSRVVHGPGGLELSLHYWRLLDRSVAEGGNSGNLESSDWDIMRALREAEDWEKLEVWVLVIWRLLRQCSTPELMEDIRQVTLELLSQRPSALQEFEDVCREESSNMEDSRNWEGSSDGKGSSDGEESRAEEEELNNNPKRVLRDICKRVRAENSPSEGSPGLPYVSLQLAAAYLF